MRMDEAEWMTITDAAKQLSVSRGTIYEAIESERIRSIVIFGRVVVFRPDVDSYAPRAFKGKRNSARPVGVNGPGGRPKGSGKKVPE